MTYSVSNCPIQPDVEKVVQLTGDLTAAIRKLRRDLHRCHTCPVAQCQLRGRFNASVQAALTQVTEEWNLRI